MATARAVNAALAKLGKVERLVWDPMSRTHYFSGGNAHRWFSSTVRFHVPRAAVERVVEEHECLSAGRW